MKKTILVNNGKTTLKQYSGVQTFKLVQIRKFVNTIFEIHKSVSRKFYVHGEIFYRSVGYIKNARENVFKILPLNVLSNDI